MSTPEPVPVTLRPPELAFSWDIGKWRNVMSLGRGARDRVPTLDRCSPNLNAAFGEVATASYTGAPLFMALDYPGHDVPDVLPDIEVRWRSPRRDGQPVELPVRDDDDRSRRFVLVEGFAPTMTLAGWIWGYDAERAEWRIDPGGYGAPAWFVPKSALSPMSTIPKWGAT